MTREEHLKWAKDRALEYADRGEAANAMELMMMLAVNGHLNAPGELRKFIEGFN